MATATHKSTKVDWWHNRTDGMVMTNRGPIPVHAGDITVRVGNDTWVMSLVLFVERYENITPRSELQEAILWNEKYRIA